MSDPTPASWKARLGHFLLDLDARLDSAVFKIGRGLREGYEAFSTFMDGRLIHCQMRLTNVIGTKAQKIPRQPMIPPR